MPRYAILQSGFIAQSDKHLSKSVLIKDPYVDFTLNKDHLKSRNDYFYDSRITKLYTRVSSDTKLINSMDFKEQVLKFAFSQFPEKYLFDWIELQYVSENMSHLHAVFLTETIELVIFGEARKITATQWLRLLENDVTSKATLISFKKYFKDKYASKFSGPYEHNVKTLENLQTLDFITQWSATPSKFMDMLVCLYVIFGARAVIPDVADNIRGY